MHNITNTTHIRVAIVVGILLLFSLFINIFIFNPIANAAAGINQLLSFQGKIVTSTSGINIPDGTYNMEFKIYSGGTDTGGGTLDWTEDYLVGGSGGGINFTSGTYNADLGSVCAFSGGSCETYTNTAIDWDSYPLYLSLQVGNTSSCTVTTSFHANCGGDGEMTPYILLTSTPYAFNSSELNGLAASSYAQLASSNVYQPTTNVTGVTVLQSTYTSPTADVFDVQGTGGSADNFIQVTSTAPNQGAVNISSLGSNPVSLNAGTISEELNGGQVIITTSAPPSNDIVSISNAGEPVTIANANGLGINYNGGNAAVEGAGLRVDYAPGGTSGGTWEGVSIVANATGSGSGVTGYGLKLVGPTSAGAGDDEAAYIGTGWDIGIDIQSGGIQLAAQSDPSSPAANNLKIYAKSIAGLVTPEWLSSTDQNTPFQPGLGFNRIAYSEPNGTANCSTGATGFGSTSTGAGTCTAPTPSSTRLLTSVRMEDYSSGTTAGTVAYQRQDVLQVWRGNEANLGGFFYTIRFGMGTLQTGNRAFVGLADSVATPTNVDPTTNTTPGKLGLAIDANSGDWNFVNNITGTAPTVTNLGSSFPVNNTDLYELIMYCPENGSAITYRVTDESTGAQTTNSVSTNIPSNTTFLAPDFWVTNNATAAAAILDFNGWYLQSDN